MSNSDPYLTVLLIALCAGIGLVAASTYGLLWLWRRHGHAEPPPDIARLRDHIHDQPLKIDLARFSPDKELNGRRTLQREYTTADGTWTLAVELDGEAVIAYRARLRHGRSWLMSTTLEGCHLRPKILTEDGV